MSEEMDFAQLVAQEEEIKILMAKCAELEAELSTWIPAVGLASTLKPDMTIDVSDPIGMMQKVVGHVEQLKADRENLLQLLESASEVIGRFVSDEGWAQSDMDTMDTIDAEIVRMRRGY